MPAEVRRRSVAVQPLPDGFRTAAVAAHVDPRTLQFVVSDLQGRTIVADSLDAIRFTGRGFSLKKSLPIGEHIYGLGDKTGPLDRRGGTFVDWNTDAFGFAPSSDPIYKSIPFYIGVGEGGTSYGLFLDNSWRAGFDFGHRDPAAIEISAPDGPIDYYVIAGPTTGDVVRRYTDLTGKPPMPPLWALGYQQSRWGYKSDAEVRGIAARLRGDRIPADVIWMDIDYQDRDRPFTVDTKAFPNLKKLNTRHGREGHSPGGDHRSPRRLFAQPGIRAVRQRQSRATISSASPTAACTSLRCGRGRRCFPTSPAPPRANGGAGCTRTSSPTASRDSGTT